MPELTRRRSPDAREECWHIYYGDVRVGTIARRVGNPFDTDPWEWDCGFYPGSHPRECTNDTAETIEQARADFERPWHVFSSKRTEADFRAPSIVPSGQDQTSYLVINNYGSLGPAFAETDLGDADLETTISGLMSGQYSDPVRVVAFNTSEHWCEDASEDVARRLCDASTSPGMRRHH
jgi:hypothetical protein